jgi:hypothetical protein
MWSGPRNISTAMMRAFGARADCAVSDEPYYAAYLTATGLIHPLRDEVIRSQPTDPDAVSEALLGPIPGGRTVWYQKHMTHHMTKGFGREWIEQVANAFLIRTPEAVLASYHRVRDDFSLDEIGLSTQVELFFRAGDKLGHTPPVVEGQDVLADPEGMLRALCAALGIAFDPAMLAWEAGGRPTDGVWAPAWYAAVEQSTGFAPPRPEPTFDDLPDALKSLAERARPLYETLAAHKLRA